MATPHLLAHVVFVAAVAAQSRHPLLGTVVDADNRVVAAARVRFCSTMGEGDEFGDRDELTAVTDQRGRFRVDLLTGRDYSGWAMTEAASTDGAIAVSRVHEDLAPGAPLVLALQLTARPRTLAVTNAAAWASRCGPLHLRIGPYARNFAGDRLPVDSDGNVVVPPLAGESHYVEVLDHDGRALCRREVSTDATTIPLQPPQAIPVCVVDNAGRPVAGATILHQLEGFQSPDTSLARWPARRGFRVGGVTGADGTAVVHVPLRESPLARETMAMFMLAQKPGFAESASGWDGVPFEDGKQVPSPIAQLHFRLQPASPLLGTLRGAKGAPIANAVVHVTATCQVTLDDGRSQYQRDWLVRTDAEGRFACHEVPPDALVDRIATTAPTGRPGSWLPGMAALHPATLGRQREVTIVEDAARQLPLTTLTVDGTPAAHALAMLLPVCDAESFQPWPFMTRLDAAGRATVQVMAGAWILFVTDGIGFASCELGDGQAAGPLDLRLQPLPVQAGQVVDADRHPVAGARFQVSRMGFANADAPHVQRSAADRVLDEVAFWLTLASLRRAETDPRGRFQFRHLDRGAAFGAHAVVVSGKLVSPEFALLPAREPLELQLGRAK